jgi:oxygen-independent coproporphyrinogen-3 oxidase
MPPKSPPPLAVYIHIPFCPTKCGYCDFNSYAMEGEIMEATTRATIAEIERSAWVGRPASTIFFGGGTPTFLAERQLIRVLEAVLKAHPPLDGAEITSEANPGTVDNPKFKAMRDAGFNRISLGAQSFVDDDLVRLGRVHRSGEIERAVEAARAAGFDNLNLDLMFALPNQSPHAWSKNLGRALALAPEHLSLYCLTIEPNTAFYKQRLRGSLPLPDDDVQVEMYDECISRTEQAGYKQYEISNFAFPGRECRHNLAYWHALEYAGYGPGAVGMVHDENGVGIRYTNLKHPERYVSAVHDGQNLAFESERLDEGKLRVERLMLGLRLNDGLDIEALRVEPKALDRLLKRGWIEFSGHRLKLSPEGRHFCSEVALELI